MFNTLFAPFVQNPLFGISLSLGFFVLGGQLHKKWPIFIFNPLLFSVYSIIILLIITKIPYENYAEGGKYLSIWITPATVSLAIKLEMNFVYFKRYYPAIITGILLGFIFHTFLIIGFGLFFNFDAQMMLTLYPKPITTAIAIGVSNSLGGIVSLTVAIVVVTGILGQVFGEQIIQFLNITNPVAQGVAMGSSSHAMGTSKAIQMGEVQGAMSGLSIVLTGITVVLLAPLSEKLIVFFFN